MSRDYAKLATSRDQVGILSRLYRVGLMVSVVAVVVLVIIGYVRYWWYASHHAANATQPSVKVAAPSLPPSTVAHPPQPSVAKFDFYTVLPKQKTAIQNPTTQPLAVKKGRYMLQVAALQHRKAAEALKERLILLGFEAYVTAVKSANTQIYRVSLGPYQQITMARDEQQRLRDNHINSMVITGG